jgi:hypothetical protein
MLRGYSYMVAIRDAHCVFDCIGNGQLDSGAHSVRDADADLNVIVLRHGVCDSVSERFRVGDNDSVSERLRDGIADGQSLGGKGPHLHCGPRRVRRRLHVRRTHGALRGGGNISRLPPRLHQHQRRVH